MKLFLTNEAQPQLSQFGGIEKEGEEDLKPAGGRQTEHSQWCELGHVGKHSEDRA